MSHATPPRGMSPGKRAEHPGLTFRRLAATRWAAFLRENFVSEAHVAHVFGVDASTARKWLAGDHAPSGGVVMMAFSLFPAHAANTLVPR